MKNAKLILSCTFVVLFHITANAQDEPAKVAKSVSNESLPFTILWESAISSGLTDLDFISAQSIIESSDGGILATGVAANGTRTGVVKIDKSSDEAWKVIYGNPAVSILPGITYEEGGMARVVAYRTDSPTSITGYLYQSKITNTGDSVWSHFEYSAEGSLLGYPIIRKLDDGYIACYTVRLGPGAGHTIALVKTNESGKKIWEERHSVDTSYYLTAAGFTVTQDGGFAILADKAQINTSGATSELMVIKTNGDGKREWEKTFDTGISEKGRAIAESKNGLLILSKRRLDSTTNGAFLRYLSVNDGDSWEKEITMDDAINGTSLCVLPDETIIVGGYTTKFNPDMTTDGTEQFFLAALNKMGEILWKDSYGTEGIADVLYSIIPLKDGSFAVAGGSGNKMYVAKLAMLPTSVVHESPASQPGFTTSPNPAQNSFTVRYAADEGNAPVFFTLCDGFGRTLEQKSTQNGNTMVAFTTEHLPNGVYYLKLNSGMRTKTQKVIIAR